MTIPVLQVTNRKATGEFVPLLNACYNRWKASQTTVTPTPADTGRPSPTPAETPIPDHWLHLPLILKGWSASPSIPTVTPMATPTATSTSTPTRTPIPTPTSFRVIDLSIKVDDSADLVAPGQVFQYVVTGWKVNPPGMVAPNTRMWGGLSPAEAVTFTGAYTVVHGARWSCDVDESRFDCWFEWDPATIYLEAVANDLASGGQASLCASITFHPPLGGGDPDGSNNHDCEATAIR